ncbi:mannitol/fructose-specific phosphotransferase system IIA component (Ntr-type) [Bacillus niacini]|uniref:Mannitol/fructose-specific phosphotransferase system IIA component (Ntr-type) n=1 Tax=Neobacillus niacini TaxID=86668 RepID=A0A852TAG6_9BACI|nr:PTS sugar transporter subunit IIA [Neobacillus niacini]NYE05743.1 mannitol/fructose-specific phosphotransferase system IIA component (Ntr-type) [Neobacillus niacini]
MLALTEKVISLDVEATTPEEAIRIAGALLVADNKVEERYVEAMVKGLKDVGPYIVIAPLIAVPHARPEQGVIQQGVSIVRLKNPVVFGHPTNDPVQIVCALCGTDSTTHIGMLQSLAAILGNKEKLKTILTTDSKEEIISITK